VSQAHEVFEIALGAEPTALEIDPDNWILNKAQEVPCAGVEDDALPTALVLGQNTPNPFARITTIAYSVPRPQHVRLDVYSTTGQKVTCLVDGDVPGGRGQVVWNGEDSRGGLVASGAYFCRLVSADGTRLVRMRLVR
jgi:hypothetical protein